MAPFRNLLLDRDGTVIVDKHYLSDPEGVELIAGVAEALHALALHGVRFFIVTNQSGIGRGYYDENDLAACTDRLATLLAEHGVHIADTVYCPHGPQAGCDCRKPDTGMWKTLQERYGLLPEESVMIGDKMADVGFGNNAGLAASILVLTGKGESAAVKADLPLPDGDWYEPSCSRAGDTQPSDSENTQAIARDSMQRTPDCIARDLPTAAVWLIDRFFKEQK